VKQINLSNVLILCAPYAGIQHLTQIALAQFQACGAAIQTGKASADVSLTRCLQALQAHKLLRARPDLEWVFWLDADMTASVEGLFLLIAYSIAMREALDFGPDLYPSLSGCYVNRHSETGRDISAFALKHAEPVEITLPDDMGAGPVIPALCGLGCFLQHRDAFIAHCESSTWFTHKGGQGENAIVRVPQVCCSRIIHASEYAQLIDCSPDDDVWYWSGEDFDYCIRELESGRLVYVAPVIFGHLSEIVLVPDNSCMFPGLRAPKPERTNPQNEVPEHAD